MLPIEDYIFIADAINSVLERGDEISSHLYQMMEYLSDSEVNDDNIDKQWLYEEIYRTYRDLTERHRIL